jgi:hypothetical protein
VVILALTLVGCVMMFIASRPPGEGPVYKGRHLSEWVEVQGRRPSGSGSSKDYFGSLEAISEAGTNAFPFLLKWIQHEDKDYRYKALKPFQSLISERKFEDLVLSPAEARAGGSTTALVLLRSNVTPEILLELERLLNTSGPQTVNRVASVFTWLGARGVRPLANVLSRPGHPARIAAAYHLSDLHMRGELGIPPKSLVPGLIQFCSDTNGVPSGITFMASTTLTKLDVTPDKYVHVLTNMLVDPDPDVRIAATNALRQIAPEVLTNAPPK